MRLFFNTLIALICAGIVLWVQKSAYATESRWYKGNVHTHTTLSDGQLPLQEVIGWYYTNNYDFLVITDHGSISTPKEELVGGQDERKMLLIPGQEVTRNNPVIDVGAINIKQFIPGTVGLPTDQEKNDWIHKFKEKGKSEQEITNELYVVKCRSLMQGAIDEIRRQGGVPVLNHPSYDKTVNYKLLVPNLKSVCLFELANGHCGLIEEDLWVAMLDAGCRIYGIAADDMHQRTYLGKAWVCVRCSDLTTKTILTALEKGDFYASTGVVLNDVRFAANKLQIIIKPAADHIRYSIEFIGPEGHVLQTTEGIEDVYIPGGKEKYIRGRVKDNTGAFAWTQPFFR